MQIVTVSLYDLQMMVDRAADKIISSINGPVVVTGPIAEKPITTKELCEYLNVTEQTIIRWKKKGKIPYLTIGSSFRFIKSDVVKALGSGCKKGGAK